jgi:hypothetical protein
MSFATIFRNRQICSRFGKEISHDGERSSKNYLDYVVGTKLIYATPISSFRMIAEPFNVEKLEASLSLLLDQLSEHDDEALKTTLNTILADFQPQPLMDHIAPLLFRTSEPSVTLSNNAALKIVGLLVSWNSSTYLKPASKAIKTEALRRMTSSEPITVSDELQGVMIQQLRGDDVEASSNAADAIVACSRKIGLTFGETAMRSIRDSWREALDQMEVDRMMSTTYSVRCASIFVALMSIGDAFHQRALSMGAGDLLLEMLQCDNDPLFQMSTLDLLELLACTLPMHHERAHWLFSNDVTAFLLRLAGGEGDGRPDPMLGGPALRVVAALCKLAHSDVSLLNQTDGDIMVGFHRALHNIEGTGEMDRLAMVDAISSFASASPVALERILQDPVTRKAWLSLSVAQPQLKAAILVSVSMVLNPTNQLDSNGDTIMISNALPSNSLGLKLYAFLGRDNNNETTALMIDLAKSPLTEVRLAAYALLEGISKQPTGAQVLLSHGHFFEFLVQREGETTMEGREAKYALVMAVFNSDVKVLLADDIVRKLDAYLKEGPHYAKPISWELATE